MSKLNLVRWYGGKYFLSAWIIDKLPDGNVYVEPFGGGANVLLNKPPHPVEVYNDINGDLVNLFRAVQDEQRFEGLMSRLEWTLFSLEEFELAKEILENSDDPDERAWAFFVVINQGFAGNPNYKSSSWGRSHTTPSWKGKLDRLEQIRDRLIRVQIEHRDALDVIKYWDREDTIFYIDPPYPMELRRSSRYPDEFEHHEELLDLLFNLKGKFALSSYDGSIYERLLEISGVVKYSKEVSVRSLGMTRSYGEKIRPAAVEVLYVKAG